jgi:hypothetical protein
LVRRPSGGVATRGKVSSEVEEREEVDALPLTVWALQRDLSTRAFGSGDEAAGNLELAERALPACREDEARNRTNESVRARREEKRKREERT